MTADRARRIEARQGRRRDGEHVRRKPAARISGDHPRAQLGLLRRQRDGSPRRVVPQHLRDAPPYLSLRRVAWAPGESLLGVAVGPAAFCLPVAAYAPGAPLVIPGRGRLALGLD